jgi:hypothetical protein
VVETPAEPRAAKNRLGRSLALQKKNHLEQTLRKKMILLDSVRHSSP